MEQVLGHHNDKDDMTTTMAMMTSTLRISYLVKSPRIF